MKSRGVEKESGKYLFVPRRNNSAILKVYCFPYAGGGAQVFLPWLAHINELIELVFIQYSGRGSRLHDPLNDDCLDVAKEIADEINAEDHPCILIGYSMGGAIAFEVARRLTTEPLVVHLCASCPPKPSGERYLLDDLSFLREVKKIGGIDERLLQDLEMRHFILKIMRNDFKLLDTYEPTLTHIKSPVHVWVGNKDHHVTVEKALAWQAYCAQPIHSHTVEGDHFFIHNQGGEIMKSILMRVPELGCV